MHPPLGPPSKSYTVKLIRPSLGKISGVSCSSQPYRSRFSSKLAPVQFDATVTISPKHEHPDE